MTNAADLEAVARQLCEAEGFDPEETLDIELNDRLTKPEQLARRSGAGETRVDVKRWSTYLKRAEQMLAAGRG